MEQAKNSLERLNELARKLRHSNEKDDVKLIEKTKKEFFKRMDDDFDTPKALAAIFDFVKEVNKEGGGKKSYELMEEADKIFNVLDLEDAEIPDEIKNLAEEREKARKEKDFKKADRIREEIKGKGYYLDDTEKGAIIKKL